MPPIFPSSFRMGQLDLLLWMKWPILELEKQAEISDTDLIITHSISQKKLLPLPLHYNADGHNINDLKICIMKCNFKDTKHRKLTELQFIINFETNIFGLNKDISFLRKYDAFKH